MPSAMIHLNTALTYAPDASPLFLVGNLAPDCLDIRELKDRTHFRSSPDREGDLIRLRDRTDKNDPFHFGILLHLFLDYKWDRLTEHDFRDVFFPDGVFRFKYYRDQIHSATSYLYNTAPHSDALWQSLCDVDPEEYASHPDFAASDIKAFLDFNFEWNKKTNRPPSEVFTPDTVNSFISRSAKEFEEFLQNGSL